MQDNKIANSNKNVSDINNLKTVTSPISQEKLVSRVNALNTISASTTSANPHNIVFNAEKGSTLNYKYVVDELVNLAPVSNVSEFCNHMYSIIQKHIESHFFAVGLYKEKSNCMNLRLQDKLGNNYSTKVFLKDEDCPTSF